MVRTMSPELRLATACCRYPRGPAARAAIAAALAGPIDWTAFEAIVRRHRIPGLAATALCTDDVALPAEVRRSLAESGRACATQDLLHAAETARLQQLFDTAGTPAMFLKGVAVGVLAYGGLGIKQSWDIDLLTTEACLIEALELLERSGYRLVEPVDLSRSALLRFARFTHEAALRNDRGITVELHWRPFSKSILPGVTGASETQSVEVGGRPVKTLREDLLIAYLIAHGQEHGWSRLKWIADLNAILAQKSAAELSALYAQAKAEGLGTRTAAALLLCAQLLGLELPAALAQTLGEDRAAARLVEVGLDCIDDPLSGIEMPVLSRTSLALIASRFSGGSNWRTLVDEAAAVWTQPGTRARYPARLDFLYHLLRIPIWLLRLPVRLGDVVRTRTSLATGRER